MARQPDTSADSSAPIEKKSAITRRLLLAAARKRLDEMNISEMKVDDITHEAGVAIGTFYLYFRDKYELMKALLREVVEANYEKDYAELDRAMPRFERIRRALRSNIRAWEENRGLFISLHQLSLTRPDFEELMEVDLRRPFQEHLEADIRSSVEHGFARPIDPAIAADVLSTMTTWTFMRWIGMNRGAAGEHTTDALIDNMALLWFRALYASDPGAN